MDNTIVAPTSPAASGVLGPSGHEEADSTQEDARAAALRLFEETAPPEDDPGEADTTRVAGVATGSARRPLTPSAAGAIMTPAKVGLLVPRLLPPPAPAEPEPSLWQQAAERNQGRPVVRVAWWGGQGVLKFLLWQIRMWACLSLIVAAVAIAALVVRRAQSASMVRLQNRIEAVMDAHAATRAELARERSAPWWRRLNRW